ncbi:MAG: iron-sulfur cluster assembly scaffold protein [Desulfobacterota bacterium]|nr:iron-sulfur cluster assembly scaffold protein [Thermodesulfobacteriota bacterium]
MEKTKDRGGRENPQFAESTSGVSKPDDFDKWLKPLYRGFMDVPGVYSASSASGSDTMTLFLRFEGDRVKQATFRTTGNAVGSLSCFFAAKLAIEKTSEELGEIKAETIMRSMGGLPEKDRPMALLAEETLGEVLRKYRMEHQKEKQKTTGRSHLTLIKPAKEPGSEKQTV